MTPREYRNNEAAHALRELCKPRDWRERMLNATHPESKTGALVRVICYPDGSQNDESAPRFIGKAIVTSDGFVQCNFITADDEMKHSAFVGDWQDIRSGMIKCGYHCKLNEKEQAELAACVDAWISIDYRS